MKAPCLNVRAIIPHPKGPQRGVLVVRPHSVNGGPRRKFSLPGGKANVMVEEEGKKLRYVAETPKQALRREIREETGIDPKGLVHKLILRHRVLKGKGRSEHHEVFEIRTDQIPKVGHEIKEFRYYHPGSDGLVITRHSRKAIREYYRNHAGLSRSLKKNKK